MRTHFDKPVARTYVIRVIDPISSRGSSAYQYFHYVGIEFTDGSKAKFKKHLPKFEAIDKAVAIANANGADYTGLK